MSIKGAWVTARTGAMPNGLGESHWWPHVLSMIAFCISGRHKRVQLQIESYILIVPVCIICILSLKEVSKALPEQFIIQANRVQPRIDFKSAWQILSALSP